MLTAALVVFLTLVRFCLRRRIKSALEIDFASKLFKLRVKRRFEQDD